MKTHRQFLAGSVMALSMSLMTGAHAQATQGGVRVGDTELKGAARTDHLTTADSYSTTQVMPIGKANKASSLIGMDVRNSQNEKLGEIKDVVVDLHSGKVAYVVLSVGGFLGIGDKYVAIPPTAFMAATEPEKLTLNADKAKLQNAPSFSKTSWPELNSPTWTSDLAYWTSDATAQGTVGSSRTGTFSSRSDATLNRTDLDRDHSATTTTTTTSSRPSLDRATPGATDRDQFRGRITTINPETGMMTIEGPNGSREFKFSERPVITLRDNRSPRLVDLKVGYPVVVGYHTVNGTYIADTVIRSDAPDVK